MIEYQKTDSFTLPGESGHEALTLQMAEKWGADVIRDSDGTVLSDEILKAGYGIYSTICFIRDHNTWAADNLDKLQQCFLITSPIVAAEESLTIELLKDFFCEQFRVNDTAASIKYWQVYDRTMEQEVDREKWYYNQKGQIVLTNIIPWHKYTVSFLAYRIWEEISMYNHTTNQWKKEHLMQIDPIHSETQEYLLQWLEGWCQSHKETTVVRFTSLFYNFAWIWGSSERNPYLFTDWGSYDFTVSPLALDQFEEKHGYGLKAEDFVNQGKYQVSHIPPNRRKEKWMEFVNDFVIRFGKKLVDIVHKYGKKAYIFFDDSWVGMEPYNGRFHEFGFDGLIKCVFSGYEVRLCSEVAIETHELRLHPYLFPVGLGGLPTFMEGGNPTLDAKKYWINIRRALLRAPVERIGLGGYLHLVEAYPDFCDYIEKVADEFRFIKSLHQIGKPYAVKRKVAVLHSWGKLRTWTLSGHFHETYMHDLIHVNEALAGLPLEVDFISFEELKQGIPQGIDVIINAGYAGSAWSGGDHWKDSEIVDNLTRWVYEGGVFLGINQPSAAEGFDTYFRMAHVLGLDEDTGARVCHGRWSYCVEKDGTLLPRNCFVKNQKKLYLTDGQAKVAMENQKVPVLTRNSFGQGLGIYLASFELTPENTRMLFNLICDTGKGQLREKYISDNVYMECAYYPDSKILVVINNSDSEQSTAIDTDYGLITVTVGAYDYQTLEL